ncbi:sensor histidine kinase [Gracilimonas sediminicola]|uniref:Histidine kinase n=1 Tax=Gracilimonas sediminicola TaxID=2952158 RepID=A0A9X2L2G0_9BACT|nr:sensor histidine kinase [Gracilimonas sediminicola]MCP9290808.1 histidine kinase [Gracilimonas sediminicola]
MKGIAATGFLSIVIFLVMGSQALSQSAESPNYVVTQFGLNEGLPQSSVNDIIQTKDGYLWMATYGGLVRFDGNSFTVFNKSNLKGLATERILELFEDRKGGIWLFLEGDLGYVQRYIGGKIETYDFGKQGGSRIELNEDERGVLWATAYGDTYRFTGTEFEKKELIVDSDLAEVIKNDSLGIWLAYEYKIVKTAGDSVIQIEDYENEEKNAHLGYIEVIEYPKHSGQLFIGTVDNGVLIQNGNSRQVFNTENGASNNNFVRFERFDEEKLIINFPGDILIWEEDKFRQMTPIPGQLNVIYRSVLKDNEGNYWFGTDGDGLFKLRSTPIHMIDIDQGLNNEKMLSLAQLNDGKALFATNCGGIYYWDGLKATYPNLNEIFEGKCNWAVYQDTKERIWIGSNDLRYLPTLEGPAITFGDEDGFTAGRVFGISEDTKGQIWVLTDDGVFVYKGDYFKNLTREDGLYYNSVRTIFEDSRGRMWIGTRAGLNRIDGGEMKKIELLSNEPGSFQEKQPPVRAIFEDGNGYIWVGTYGNGLYRVDGNKVLNITEEDGLYDNIISHIVEDGEGNFWMGSNRGISSVKRSDLNGFLDGEIDHIPSNSYGAADGMNSAETNGGFQPSTFTDSLGRIYFPTVAGVAVVNPGLVRKNEVSPRVYIEKLNTDEGPVELSSGISLSYNTSYLEILYTAISFSEPGKVEFRYKMEGLNDDWIEVGNRREALYSKIPPGNYTFRVIAGNSDGVWNMEGASLAITVVPPFWQTTWFYTLMGLLVAGAGGLVYYLRIEQLKRQNARQKRFTEQLIESEEQERKRIASELHDSLGQQILVIKNRAELARKFVDQPAELDEQLDEIMQSAVTSIEDVRSISHGLRPVHLEKFGLTEALNNLCSQVQDSSSIEWSYHVDDIDEVISKDKEINFYRVIQEGITNIFKHSKASEASVIIRRAEPGLKAMIWDNGAGFDPDDKLNAGGLGLSGMNERVETLGGTLSIDSGKTEGTTITIVIPVKEWAMS